MNIQKLLAGSSAVETELGYRQALLFRFWIKHSTSGRTGFKAGRIPSSSLLCMLHDIVCNYIFTAGTQSYSAHMMAAVRGGLRYENKLNLNQLNLWFKYFKCFYMNTSFVWFEVKNHLGCFSTYLVMNYVSNGGRHSGCAVKAEMTLLKLPEMLEARQWWETMARESCWQVPCQKDSSRGSTIYGPNIKFHASYFIFPGSDAPHNYDYYYKLPLCLLVNENSAENGVYLPSWGFYLFFMAFLKAWLRWFRVWDAGPGSAAVHLWDSQDLRALHLLWFQPLYICEFLRRWLPLVVASDKPHLLLDRKPKIVLP